MENIPATSTSPEAAARGFLAMSFTFSIILSMGFSTSLLASEEKKKAPMLRRMQTKRVRKMPIMASILVYCFCL